MNQTNKNNDIDENIVKVEKPLLKTSIAVEIENMSLSYGKQVLNHINMTVPHASIYALLGPSGCGEIY